MYMMLRARNRSDIVSAEVRSRMMRAVRQERTRPELRVRRIVRSMGVSFCVHNKNLPGSPDLANRRQRWAVFVHGCFWHGHKNCRRTTSRTPKANAVFWAQKFKSNRQRDAIACKELRSLGFKVAIVWECALEDEAEVCTRLMKLISKDSDVRS
jgi:DNA mismatch endonuclease, patch repair protein